MKYTTILILSISFLLNAMGDGASVKTNPPPLRLPGEKVAAISGVHLKLIKKALVEVEKKGIDIDEYNVTIFEHKECYGILFKHKDISPTQYGSPYSKPVYTVEIDKKTLCIRKLIYNI